MKKQLLILSMCIALTSCTHPVSFIDPNTKQEFVAESYGIANEEAKKINGVIYEVSAGNVIWSIILCETLIAPVYFIGWSIKQPVKLDPKYYEEPIKK